MQAVRYLSMVVLCSAAMPALAQEHGFPPRREGLWEVTNVTEKPDKTPKINMRMCVDKETDAELMGYGMKVSKDTCQRYDVVRKGQTWTIDSHCKIGPISTTSKALVSGDFRSSVTVRVEGSTEGMPGTSGPQRMQMTQTARWVSAACEGMKPGDIALDGGIKVNVKQLKQLQKLIPGLIR
ncbi:MAG: DUF3617 family protein [Hyphomicrobiaceae bacterium]|nr:DUF3617 family protein [Hyphomicrobiaceae bacterium]